MSRVVSPVSGKSYGLAAVCCVWRLARSGVYRHQAPPPATQPQRRGPEGPMSDEALTAAIRAVIAASPFHGEGHRKIWARLRHAGTRTSLRRVLRLMRMHYLLAPTRVGAPRGPRDHNGTIIPETMDTIWGTDLTTTRTGEGPAAVFIAVDHCSAECVGIHAHARATRFEALEPIRQGVRQRFNGFAKDVARGLALRHDHGSQYMSDHFHKEIAFLGIKSSPAFVRALEGNGCAERFIRTLKENLRWVQTFETIEDLRQAVLAFRDTYNTTWLIERHGFITPEAVRHKQLHATPKGSTEFNPVSQKPQAVHKGFSRSAIVEAAVASFLSPDGADRREAAFARRLDRLSRQVQRLERNVGISTETLALFVRFWLTIRPPLPTDAQAAAQAKGRERYEGFIEALGRRLQKGQSLLHEIPEDIAGSLKPVRDIETTGKN